MGKGIYTPAIRGCQSELSSRINDFAVYYLEKRPAEMHVS
jgi:hypothetical protein